ncbi:ABC transporter ATP-binding protein [Bengtsoniella intestinalis]|uniref:ABC transporter ATP-binding protein n=1 Tax=Bengtsoniella intestinalis TaxID=3073143 RepID=UPI00391FBAF3
MLSVKNLVAKYGHIEALNDVSIDLKEGQIISIIGANGAGKTTLLSSISAMKKPESGSVIFMGEDITGMKPNKIVKKGIAHVPEGRHIFAGMTVRENLLVGGYTSTKQEIKDTMEEMNELFPILKGRESQMGGTLSGGEQQMLAIARGMMAKPKLLLLDEPSLGLAPLIVEQVFQIIQNIRDQGVSIVFVEQNAKKALEICDKAYVIENGRISMSGTGAELLASEAVTAAYLGKVQK